MNLPFAVAGAAHNPTSRELKILYLRFRLRYQEMQLYREDKVITPISVGSLKTARITTMIKMKEKKKMIKTLVMKATKPMS